MNTPRELFQKRKDRVRSSLKKAANGKMRLSVFRSGLHIYAQIIDDAKGVTVVSASTLEKAIRDNIKKSSTVEAASYIGKVVAERAVKSGVSDGSRKGHNRSCFRQRRLHLSWSRKSFG